MPHPFELTLKQEGKPDVSIRGEFADDEHSMLQSYLEQYEELAQSKPLREGFPCEMSLRWNEKTALEVETSLPDADTLSILLHRLRPFILKAEPASFDSVCSTVGRRIHHPFVRRLLRNQRELYDGRKSQNMLRITLDETVVNSERVLLTWLNSREYHRDPDKRRSIDALLGQMPGDLGRGVLVSMLVDKVEAIRHLASLVHVLLTSGEQLTFQVPETNQPQDVARHTS